MVISSLCIAPGVCFLWDIKAAVPRDRVTYKDASQLARQTLRLRDKWPWACLEFPSLVVCYLCWGWGNGDQVIADNCQGVRALQSSWYISASGYGCESMCALWVRVCVCVCARTYFSQEAQHHLGPGGVPQGHVSMKSGWIPIPPPDNPIELCVLVPSPIYSESSHSHHPKPIPPINPSLFNIRTFPPNKCWAKGGKIDAVVLSLCAYLDGSMLV